MISQAKEKLILLSIIITIYILAWYIQNLFILNPDLSWLTHASQLLLKGGSYSNNFYETNPPLILYLYFPIVYLIKSFHLSLEHASRIYIDLLASLSLLISYTLSKKIIDSSSFIFFIFIVTLSIVFLIVPLSDFGQREQLTLILIMPYLLLTTIRLENKEIKYPITTGIMAGVGFCIKPFFLFIFILLSIYVLLKQKKIFSLFTAENIAICCVTFFYVCLIFIFHQDYLQIILPLIAPFYYSLFTKKLSVLLQLPFSIFFYLTTILFLLRKNHRQNTLEVILYLASLGFFLMYLFQRTDWYYHEYPTFALSILLITLLFISFLSKPLEKIDYLKLIGLNLMMCWYIGAKAHYLFTNIPYPFYLSAFFSLFAWIFGLVLLSAYSTRLVKALSYDIIIILSCMALFQYLLFTRWYDKRVLLTSAMLFLLFAYAIPNQTIKTLGKWLLLSLFGLLIYAYPFYRIAYVTTYSQYYHQLYQPLISATKIYQQKSTYYFTNSSEDAFPLIDYTHQHYASRFWSFIWLPIFYEPKNSSLYPVFYKLHQSRFDFYIENIIEDFKKNKPDVVFVDDKIHSNKFYYGMVSPDYVALLSENSSFAKLWKHYQLTRIIDLQPLCRFKVFERKN